LVVDTIKGGLGDPDGISSPISYRWFFRDNVIAGEISSTILLNQSYVGGPIKVEASWLDGGGVLERVMSDSTPFIENKNDPPVVSRISLSILRDGSPIGINPYIDLASNSWLLDQSTVYSPRIGDSISITASITDIDNVTSINPSGSVLANAIKYQWNSDNVPIPGGNTNTLLITNPIANKKLSVSISYSDNLNAKETIETPKSFVTGLVVEAPQRDGFLGDSTFTTGQDLLIGNFYKNYFLIQANSSSLVDSVRDFLGSQGDRLYVRADQFYSNINIQSLQTGQVDPSVFIDRTANPTAALPNAACFFYIKKDGNLGQLWLDPDGSGNQNAILVAELVGAPVLAATDIWI